MKRVIAFIGGLVFTAMLFAGCAGDGQSFTQKNYEADGALVQSIRIEARDRQITVSRSEDEQIHIAYAESEKEYYDISVSEDSVLSMIAVENKQWSDYIGSKPEAENRQIFLRIPDACIATLEISTTNAEIALSALKITEDLILSANGGDISLDQISVGRSIVLSGKNGDITGSISGAYEEYAIVCKIKKGESNLPGEKEGQAKTLSVHMNHGDVEIEFCR